MPVGADESQHGSAHDRGKAAPRSDDRWAWWTAGIGLAAPVRERWSPSRVQWVAVLAIVAVTVALPLAVRMVDAVALFASPSPAALSPPTADWSGPGYDATHSRSLPGPAPNLVGEIVWRFEVGEQPTASGPVPGGGRITIGSFDGHLYSLDAVTGEVVWLRDLGEPVHAPATLVGARAYAPSLTGELLALEVADGATAWALQTSRFLQGSATVVDGALYVGTGDGRILAVDAASGELRWSYPAADPVLATVAVTHDVVVGLAEDGSLDLLDRGTGRRRLRYEFFQQPGLADPVVGSGHVFQVMNNGVLYAIDRGVRNFPLDRVLRLACMKLDIWFNQWFGVTTVLPCPERQTGLAWLFRGAGTIRAAPAIDDAHVYVGTISGTLAALDPETGAVRWTADLGAALPTSPLVIDDRVLVVDAQGTVHQVARDDGAVLATTPTGVAVTKWPSATTVAPVYTGGMLFIRGVDRVLYAVR